MNAFAYFFSHHFLLNRKFLWLLFWINLLGTVYGFEWYGHQIVYTYQEMAPWLVWFVPDSPTASLFFTMTIGYLLYDEYKDKQKAVRSGVRGFVRGLIEALALITSVKYGIWAVLMIVAGAMQGDALVWQDWMLMGSHLGMAIEALLFARFFSLGWLPILVSAVWTLCNDGIDYGIGVFPWLPKSLMDNLGAICIFTVGLSIICILIAVVYVKIISVKRA